MKEQVQETGAGSNGTYQNPTICGTQHGSGSSGDFALTIKNGKIGFFSELPDSKYVESNKFISDGIWKHIVVTKSPSGVITIYVNAEKVLENSGNTGTIRISDLQYYNWEIGRAYWYGEDASMLRYNGKIALHRLYNNDLPETDVKYKFNLFRHRFGV